MSLTILGAAAVDLDVPAEPSDDRSAGAVVITAEPDTLIWRGVIFDSTRAVFKMYRRRSLTTVWRSRLSRFRVEREYDALRFLQRHGIRCGEPLLWIFGYSPAHGRYEILATREIAAAVPLSELLENGTDLDATHLSSLYQMIRTMHGKGLQHGALIPRNILVTRTHGGVWTFHMIDMPRAIVFPATVQGTPMARMDLMDLTGPVRARFGDGAARKLLGHYGLSEHGIAALFDDLKKYRPNRHTRTRLRGEFKLRALFAWLAAGRRPSW